MQCGKYFCSLEMKMYRLIAFGNMKPADSIVSSGPMKMSVHEVYYRLTVNKNILSE